jgi:adenylate cyclase
VTLLLEGSVQHEGDRLRVMLRVVDAAIESTVWSRRFDGAAGDALAMQDSATAALVAAFDTTRR